MSELLNFVLQHEQFRQARLPSLYSDFRYLKTTNPSGFHANVTSWKTVLADACRAGKVGDGSDKLVLSTGEDLTSAVQTRDWGRPLALGVVVAEAVHSQDLYPLDQFLSSQTSIYHWSYVGAVLNWGLERIGLKSPPNVGRGIISGQFVVVRNVEDAAKDITRALSTRNSSLIDRIFTFDLFASEFAPTLSAVDLKVLLCYLSRDARVCAFDGETVKLRSPSEQRPDAITEQDTTIAHLKALVRSLHSRVDTLSADLTKCTERAQAAVANKNRTVALAALRSRRTVENTLAHQSKALGQVEEVMASIQTAADNIELVRVLERSSKVLSGLNKEVGGLDRVDRIMEGLREETETVSEVSQMLAEGEAVVDDEAVEDELEAMMKEVEDAAARDEMVKELEKIPRIDATDRQLSDSLEDMKLGGGGGEKDEELERVHA